MTLFVVNPGVKANGPGQPAIPGHVHTIEETHPMAVLAQERRDGWRLATRKEIREYCDRYNVEMPDDEERSEVAAEPVVKVKAVDSGSASSAATRSSR